MAGNNIAWSTVGQTVPGALPVRWPAAPSREWAWGGSTGRGVRVCVVDSGIEHDHPSVGPVDGAVAVEPREGGGSRVVRDGAGDVGGHGTACASVIRRFAPDCALHSVRVLGADCTGTAGALVAGLTWAIEQRFDVINLSMSSRKRDLAPLLHELADTAYFHRTVLVCSAHNSAVESFPWRFASVISVGAPRDRGPVRVPCQPAPRRSSSSRAGRTSKSAGSAGRRSRAPATRSRPHTSADCARRSSPSIPASRRSSSRACSYLDGQ